jgi:hypothetical protein
MKNIRGSEPPEPAMKPSIFVIISYKIKDMKKPSLAMR